MKQYILHAHGDIRPYAIRINANQPPPPIRSNITFVAFYKLDLGRSTPLPNWVRQYVRMLLLKGTLFEKHDVLSATPTWSMHTCRTRESWINGEHTKINSENRPTFKTLKLMTAECHSCCRNDAGLFLKIWKGNFEPTFLREPLHLEPSLQNNYWLQNYWLVWRNMMAFCEWTVGSWEK